MSPSETIKQKNDTNSGTTKEMTKALLTLPDKVTSVQMVIACLDHEI